MRFGIAALLGMCLLANACAHQEPARTSPEQITILISIDGFRPDYLDRGISPTLSHLARDGVTADMRPSFPSVTFPNHYTLVTGRHPGAHGLINNRMEDAARPGVVFTIGNRAVASDPIWWSGATPLWVTAERQGVRTGTMLWPGSDIELGGVRPAQWRLFDQLMPEFARVDVLLSWLDAPAAERPRFLTLYFDAVDTAGHRYGPDALETNAAIAQVDAAMARLVDGLEARGFGGRVNFVIVADHGMAAVSDARIIDLDALAPAGVARVIWDGPFAAVQPVAGREAEAQAAIMRAHEHGQCWAKADLPARFAYSTHSRIPAYVCVAEMGWRYRSTVFPPYSTPSLGAHGYDPAAPEMAALFIASGPAFRDGATLPSFENVSVYPLLAHLTGVTPDTHDGALADVAEALATPPSANRGDGAFGQQV